jgi:hypothetical protein
MPAGLLYVDYELSTEVIFKRYESFFIKIGRKMFSIFHLTVVLFFDLNAR